MEQSHTPLHLAEANDIPSFSIEASSEFFPNPVSENEHEHDNQELHSAIENNGMVGDSVEGQPTQEDIDAVIKASLSHAQAQAQAAQDEQVESAEHALVTAEAVKALTEIDPALIPPGEDENQQEGESSTSGTNKKRKINSGKAKILNNDELGSESNPISNPTLHIAPFSKPLRDLENTPSPLFLNFQSKKDFLRWLDAESSWCHFVQRRTTTPDKRSAERLQSRIRAHNRSLEAMTPEERAEVTPLKTRRRKRVSPVFEKVTFTCHHAGTYESKHSSVLPKEKLRLNTKKSVKCACASRIVLSELQTGDCKVVYHWVHEGHDPFSDNDLEGGRLPKSIDNWLNKQIEIGNNLDDIRKVLSIPEEEKEAYLAKVASDPTALDPNMPPPLALALKVKYPDIYNRYRKLKGPVKEHKQMKGTTKKVSNRTTKSNSKGNIDMSIDSDSGEDQSPSVSVIAEGIEEQIIALNGIDGEGKSASLSEDIDPLLNPQNSSNEVTGEISLDPILESSTSSTSYPKIESSLHTTTNMIDEHSEVDSEFAQLASSHDLLNASTQGVELDLINSNHDHEGLARALLELPSSGGLRDENGIEMSLEEAMRRMAEGVAEVAAAAENGNGGEN